jgi:hypothetical protein
MKIIVKNNMVIGKYNDEQDIETSYINENVKVRHIPNDFRYDVPIYEQNDDGLMAYRHYVECIDVDPVFNSTNISLNNRKLIAGNSISKEVENFIFYKADGEVRYTQVKQSSFTDILMGCKEWLEDNPNAEPDEKKPYEDRIAAINSVRVWIRDVLSYYYTVVGNIRAATEETWATVANWDLSPFNDTDPDVWLESVYM